MYLELIYRVCWNLVTPPEPDDEFEQEAQDDVSKVAKDVTKVIECSVGILAEVVVVAGVEVSRALRGLLVVIDQLEDWQGVVDTGQEDQIEEQFWAELHKVWEIFGVVVEHRHVEHRNHL